MLPRAALMLVLTACAGSSPPPAAPISAHVDPVVEPPPPPPPPPPVEGDSRTGFDLYVTPNNVPGWSLDGEHRTDRLPSRIRGLSPGAHTLAIDAAPGYVGTTQQLTIVLGEAPRIEIVLAAAPPP